MDTNSPKPSRAWHIHALFTVPVIVALGFFSGRSARDNFWYEQLRKPELVPPDWMFGAAWTLIYVLLGLAVARVLATPATPERRYALGLFLLQLVLNLAWSPLFFGAQLIVPALALIVVLLVVALCTAVLFARIDGPAGGMFVPYLVWLGFATYLNWQIHVLNP